MNISKNSYGSYEFYELSFQEENGQIDVYEGKVEGGCELKTLSIVVSMVAVSLIPLLRI